MLRGPSFLKTRIEWTRNLALIASLFFLGSTFYTIAYAQSESRYWMIQSQGIDFSTPTPTVFPLSTFSFPTWEGISTVSDENGNLLFYSNSEDVFDSTYNTMPNGDSLGGNVSNSQTLAVRKPGTSTLYYLFTTQNQTDIKNNIITGFRYAIIDLNLNNGNGDVLAANQVVYNTCTETIAAIRHANKTDVWIVTHEMGNNNFRSYLLTCNGLDTIPVVSSVGFNYGWQSGNAAGQIKGSSDGNYIATSIRDANLIEIFRFDDSTGILSNPVTLNKIWKPYGVEFSKSEKYLFANGNSGFQLQARKIFRYDLSNYGQNSIQNSVDSIDVPTAWNNNIGGMQIRPGGEIYVARSQYSYLSVIQYPDSSISNVQFLDSALSLGSGSSSLGLPHGFSKKATSLFASQTNCSDTAFYQNVSNYKPDSLLWNFGDPSSGPFNTSTSDTTFHFYQNPGQYIVTLVSYRSCESDTTMDTITIGPPQFSLTDTIFCDAQPTTLDAGVPNKQYLWSTGDSTQTILVNNPGTYHVTVTDSAGCTASDTSIVSVDIPVTAIFQIDTTGCPNMMFIDSSNGNPTSWQWLVDDSLVSNYQVANYQFPNNGQYKVTLIASDNCGSDTINDSILVDCIVSVGDWRLTVGDIRIFPNPNDGNFTVQVHGQRRMQQELILYNLFGQTILQTKLNPAGETQIKTKGLSKGIYMAEIRIGEARIVKNLIID